MSIYVCVDVQVCGSVHMYAYIGGQRMNSDDPSTGADHIVSWDSLSLVLYTSN